MGGGGETKCSMVYVKMVNINPACFVLLCVCGGGGGNKVQYGLCENGQY